MFVAKKMDMVPQTFDEVCTYLRGVEEEVSTITKTIRQKGKDLIILRFKQGRAVHIAAGMRGGYGEKIVNALSERTGIHERTLYYSLQFYRHPQFKGSETRLLKWIEDTEEEKGNAITWSYCKNWVQKSLPEHEEEAESKLEAQQRRLKEKAEKLEEQARKLEEEASDLENEVGRWNGQHLTEEVAGVVQQAIQIAEDTRAQAERMMLQKPKRFESPEYLKHVRSYGCLICSSEACDAHHVMTGGMGTKTHDVFTIPLCREHHDEMHRMGPIHFESKYQVNIWQNVAFLLAEYFVGIEQ